MKTIDFTYGPSQERGTIRIVGPHVVVEEATGESSWCLTCTFMQSGNSECCLVGWTVDCPLTHSYLEDLRMQTYREQFLAMMPDDIRLAVAHHLRTIPGFCED